MVSFLELPVNGNTYAVLESMHLDVSKIVASSALGIMFLLLLKIKGFTLQQEAIKIEYHFGSFVLFFPSRQSFIMLDGGFIFLDVNSNCNEIWFIPEETVSHKIFKC